MDEHIQGKAVLDDVVPVGRARRHGRHVLDAFCEFADARESTGQGGRS